MQKFTTLLVLSVKLYRLKLNFYPSEFVEFMFDGVLKSLYGKDNSAKDVDEIILKAVREIFHLTPDNYDAISIDVTAKNLVMNVYPFRLQKNLFK